MNKKYLIYSDGSSKLVNGVWLSGIGAVILNPRKKVLFEISRGYQDCTIPRAELLASLESIKHLDERSLMAGSEIKIFSDNEYTVNSYNIWINKWRLKNYERFEVKADKVILVDRPHKDLLQQMYAYKTQENLKLNYIKIKAHSGNKFNNMADKLAKDALFKLEESFLKTQNSQIIIK